MVHTLRLMEMTQLRAGGQLCGDWRIPGTAEPAPTPLWGSKQVLLSPRCPCGHSKGWDSIAFALIRKTFWCRLGFSWTQLGQAATQQLCVVEHRLSPREKREVTSSQDRNHKHRRGRSKVLPGEKNFNLLKPGIGSASGKHSLEVETKQNFKPGSERAPLP